MAFGLIANHPFVDGNKRIGVQAMLVLLYLNHIELTVTNDDLVALGFGLAQGTLNTDDVVLWITTRIAPIR